MLICPNTISFQKTII